MSKTIYLLLFVVFTFFSIQSWRSSYRDHEIKKEGGIALPTIVERPRYSSGTASMMVTLDGKRYRLEIGSNYCSDNRCKVGDKVKVIYNSAYDRIVLPDDNTAAGLYLSGILTLVPLYCLYMLLKR